MVIEKQINFEIKTIDTASEASKAVLQEALKKYGFEANLFGLMANHPALLNTYWEGVKFLAQDGSLTVVEREVAFLATSFENKCNYCMTAHSTVAEMIKLPQQIIDSLRNGTSISDPKLEALSQFVKAMTVKRGAVSSDDIQNFINAGYSKETIFEIVLIVALKAMTNYAGLIGNAPIDKPFQPNNWAERE